ncbi:MAG: cytochrome c maturation protein CcmE [Dehalococcoidia bacterium]|nr:cytochrome c maturation protein CcmE [Dehalococcoidia bacterium]
MSAVNSRSRAATLPAQGRIPERTKSKAVLPRLMRQKKFIFAGVVIGLAIAYLIFSALQGTTMYYLTVSEIKARGEVAYTEPVRLGGRVLDGTIDFDRNSRVLKFTVTDGKESLPVVYSGVVPDAFKPDADVIIEGTFNGKVFAANTLLAKCPSKYVPSGTE